MNFYISSLQYAKDNNCNYAYDQEGRLIQDLQEQIASIEWRVDGKVKRINRIANSTKQNLSFDYDAMGHRIAKHVYTSANVLEKSTYYVLDATGKQIAVYERSIDENTQSVAFQLTERTIYGTTRVGSLNKTMNLLGSAGTTSYVQATVNHSIGKRSYELANHLGSVITVLSDKVIPHSNGSTVDYWQSDNLQSTDYSPFGVQLNNRTLSKSGVIDFVRFGYQGSEMDNELKNGANSYTTFFRQLDPRLGRWMSLDPKLRKYSDISPYVSFANNPILFVDDNGDTIRVYGSLKEQQKTVAYLQTLTNDRLILKNNMILIKDYDAVNLDKKLVSGTALVRELVVHKNTVSIRPNDNEKNSANRVEGTPSELMFNGKGCSAYIYFDPFHSTSYLTENANNGKTDWTASPRQITLSHELIHALYIMNGTSIKFNTKDSYIYQDTKNIKWKITQEKEETDTVGLTGNRKYTENKIRKEQGFRKRVKY